MATPQTHSTRTCVGTRSENPREALLGWFVGPDGTPWPDWTGRGGRHVGRGAWTLPSEAAIRQAAKRNGFAGAFRAELAPYSADILLDRVRASGRKVFLERIGLANRAGALAVGQASALERMASGKVVLLLLAQDGGASGQNKFEYTARVRGIETLVVESGATLGAALGREFVSVVAVERSAFSRDLVRWAGWLLGVGSELLVTRNVDVSGSAASLQSEKEPPTH